MKSSKKLLKKKPLHCWGHPLCCCPGTSLELQNCSFHVQGFFEIDICNPQCFPFLKQIHFQMYSLHSRSPVASNYLLQFLLLSPACWAPLEVASMAGELQNQHWEGSTTPWWGSKVQTQPPDSQNLSSICRVLWLSISRVTKQNKFQKCILTQVIWRPI